MIFLVLNCFWWSTFRHRQLFWICKRSRDRRPPALCIKYKDELLEYCTIPKDNVCVLSIQPSPLIAAAPAEERVSYYSEAERAFSLSLFTHLIVYSQWTNFTIYIQSSHNFALLSGKLWTSNETQFLINLLNIFTFLLIFYFLQKSLQRKIKKRKSLILQIKIKKDV